jgi:uncharacterized protein (TIGR00369 family)
MSNTTATDYEAPAGLDLIQGIVDGRSPGAPLAATLGFAPVVAEPGRVIFHGTPLEHTTNPHGGVHGGWYGAILDSCMACAVWTKVPAGSTYTTLEYKVNIIRPIPQGMQVEAIGTSDHAGRSTGIAHGEIRGVKNGKLYATGSTTCMVLKLT